MNSWYYKMAEPIMAYSVLCTDCGLNTQVRRNVGTTIKNIINEPGHILHCLKEPTYFITSHICCSL